MKKTIALLLALALCLSLCACSGGNDAPEANSNEVNNAPTDSQIETTEVTEPELSIVGMWQSLESPGNKLSFSEDGMCNGFLPYEITDGCITISAGAEPIPVNIGEFNGITTLECSLSGDSNTYVRTEDYAKACETYTDWRREIIVGKWVSDDKLEDIIINNDGTCIVNGENLLWSNSGSGSMSGNANCASFVDLTIKQDKETRYILQFVSYDNEPYHIVNINTPNEVGGYSNYECNYYRDSESNREEANKATETTDTQPTIDPNALYVPYIGEWVCSDGYYVIVNEDGTIIYNDVEYTPEYFEMGDGVAVHLEDAEYTYYAGMDKNGEVYTTAKGCVFVWGLTERFGEGVMVGDHDGRQFILQAE